MEFQNAKRNAAGGLDVEINHPTFGWIPYTIGDDDPLNGDMNAALTAAIGDNFAAYVPEVRSVEDWRAGAFLQKDDFIVAAFDAGVLTEAAAEAATNGWPSDWDAFFLGQSARDRIAAKALWARSAVVYRSAPLIAGLQSFASLTDADVDALFGWVDPA